MLGYLEGQTTIGPLQPGEYRVELEPHGIDRSQDLPRTINITAGQTTRLDVSIDTGLR